jgi:hypothetical protein
MSEQRSWKANWAVEREERLAHLAELPGKEHHERLEALNRVSRLFSTNGTELSNHIGTFVGTGRHVDELPDEFEHEAVRLFHNYIASVATLRDVQRSTPRRPRRHANQLRYHPSRWCHNHIGPGEHAPDCGEANPEWAYRPVAVPNQA